MTRRSLPILLTVLLGAVLARMLAGGWTDDGFIWGLRAQRVLTGLIVGGALSVGGVFLQSLLRNPLASPDLIGPAAGAGLAVMARAYLLSAAGLKPAAGVASNAPAALLGALAALGLVYVLSRRRGFIEPVVLVLIGVIVSVLCGAVTLFLANLLPDSGFQVARWMVGNLSEETSKGTLAAAGVCVALGLALGWWLGPSMDVAALGEDEARSSGVELGRLRAGLFVASGLLTACAVVLAGPVGFVGLVCPHIARLLAGSAHRTLVVGAALAGGALVVGADAATKAMSLGGGRMPLGVLTALIGGPVFIVLLRRDRFE